jgi:hypothetical protein
MPAFAQRRGLFLFLPRDHFRRKRIIRRLGTASFIILFSIVVAYVLTRPVGGQGFSLSKSAKNATAPVPNSSSPSGGDTPPQVSPAPNK